MLIYPIKNQNSNNIPKPKQQNLAACRISFKGNDTFERSKTDNTRLIHQTALFREPITDKFVQDYIRENFMQKPEINIVSGACSSGEEAYSYACMLNDTGKKINITGFDISAKIIKSAKKGIVNVKKYRHDFDGKMLTSEGFLLDDYVKTDYQAKCKKNFLKYFEPMEEKKTTRIPPALYKAQKQKYQKAHRAYKKDKNKGFGFIREKMGGMLSLLLHETYDEQKFKYNSRLAPNCRLDFVQGDILKLNELFPENGKIDIFLYRNALYHNLCTNVANFRIPNPNSNETMTFIAKEMNRVMSKDGLVVFGEREEDEGIDECQIFEIMTKNGFKPICLHKKFGFLNRVNIWQKVSDVE